MIKTLFTLCTLLLFNLGFSQVNFVSVSLNEALKRAATEGKFVWVQFEAAGCEQCNNTADKGFENKELSAKMEQVFVCLKIDEAHPDRAGIAATYSLSRQKSFGTFFLDNNGTLLHSFRKTTTNYKDYLLQIETALNRAGEVLNIGTLEKEYKAGNRGFGFLEMLLQKRKAVHLPTDELLNEYIAVLPADSLTVVRTLAFIAQMAPMLDSKADKTLRANQMLFNRAWYSLSAASRASINNTIIAKGMIKAIEEKDEKLALRTASFAQGTNTNATAGAKAYDMNMLRYYDGTGDTANYFRKSIAYYERYFFSVSPDSIKKTDSMMMVRLRDAAKKDTVREGNRMRITANVMYRPVAQRFSAELHNGAYGFYLRTNNAYLLSIATEWAKRALGFYESPEALNIYAKLLYKQAQKEAAVEQMKKALALLQKKHGLPTKTFEATLAKMNNNEKLTD